MVEPSGSDDETDDDDIGDTDSFYAHRGRELAVNPHRQLSTHRDIGLDFGLLPALILTVCLCRNAILLSLSYAVVSGRPGIHYSRNTNRYSHQKNKQLPTHWTYANVMAAVNMLEERPELFVTIRQQKGRPQQNSKRGRQSSIEPARGATVVVDALLVLADAIRVERTNASGAYGYHGGSPTSVTANIVLRNQRKVALPFEENDLTRSTQIFLDQYTRAVEAVRIEIGTLPPDAEGRVKVPDSNGGIRVIDLRCRRLTRIFNSSFAKGGRLYRACWLQMGSSMRSRLLIDGQDVYEHDYKAWHIRLLYAAIEMPCLPDPYQIPGYESARSIIKFASLVMLNASSEKEACKVIIDEMEDKSIPGEQIYARHLMEAIQTRLPEIKRYWYTGVGKQLQRCDSDIIILCLIELLNLQIVGLPIHDSIVVQKQHKFTLIKVMERVFATEGKLLAKEHLSHLATKPRKPRGAGNRNQVLTATASAKKAEEAGVHNQVLTLVGEGGDDWMSTSSLSQSFWVELPTNSSSDSTSPILTDLELIVRRRKTVDAVTARVCFRAFVSALGYSRKTMNSAQAWLLGLAHQGCHVDPVIVQGAREVVIRPGTRKISPALASTLCGITLHEAYHLGLSALHPALHPTSNQQAMAQRWNAGSVPILLDVGAFTPWKVEGMSESSWYRRGGCSQVRSLQLAIAMWDDRTLADVRVALDDAMLFRRAYCDPLKTLPVDLLMSEFSEMLAAYDKKQSLLLQPLRTPLDSLNAIDRNATERIVP